MNKVHHGTEPGQVISHFFDFSNCVKSVGINEQKLYIRAPKSDMIFNPFGLWNFIENPDIKIEENGLILLEAPAYKPGSVIIEVTDQLLEYLPEPRIETIKFALATTAFPSLKYDSVWELKGVLVFHLLEPPYVADIKDGILTTWPLDYEGEDFLSKAKKHQQPPVTPKPKQKPKPKKYPPLRVVSDSKPAKPDRRKKKKAPPDVLKYYSWLAPKSNWPVTFKAMYSQAWYGGITKNKFYQGKKSYTGRYYTMGNKRLENVTGISGRRIVDHVKLMLEHNIVQRRKKGRPDLGNSIIELPFNLAHTMAWKREHKTKAKQTGKQ